jgi:hypothetical protein
MSEDWEGRRRRDVNLARAATLQRMLEEAGYFRAASKKADLNAERTLLNFLVDYLHFADREGQPMTLTTLQELAKSAHDLYEKEPHFSPKQG